ncbi:MAG: rod shape-determining protein RodA [Candidatus Cloacimonetes bacterium]|nr:rod shape-determining protein RodA [Candidatus Cloacimonadota bacterium]
MINKKKFDFVLAATLLIIIILGCIAIFTASSSKIGEQVTYSSYWWKQIVFSFVVFGLLILLLELPMPIFELIVTPLYVINILALILVFFTTPINGAHRWFSIAGFNYQPSESAKLLTILMVAKVIHKEGLGELRQVFYALGITILPVVLIMAEPDFGTTLVFWAALFAMLIAAKIPLFYVLIMVSPVVSLVFSTFWFGLVLWLCFLTFLLYKSRLSWVAISVTAIVNLFLALIMPVFWNGLKDYQQSRVLTFIDPMRDPLGAGYQIIQSKIAIGSGAAFGKGWLDGTQKNMNFLPEHHTDFIFSVIGEEFGFLGGSLLLLVFFILFWRLTKAISEIKINERRIAASGIFAYLVFQTFINIGMNIGLVPATGIPLPFISYGGSNLVINSIGVGVIMKYLNERGFIK